MAQNLQRTFTGVKLNETETTYEVAPRRGWLYTGYALGTVTLVIFLSAFIYPNGEVETSWPAVINLPLLHMTRGQIGSWIIMWATGLLATIYCLVRSERPRRSRDDTTIDIRGFTVA